MMLNCVFFSLSLSISRRMFNSSSIPTSEWIFALTHLHTHQVSAVTTHPRNSRVNGESARWKFISLPLAISEQSDADDHGKNRRKKSVSSKTTTTRRMKLDINGKIRWTAEFNSGGISSRELNLVSGRYLQLLTTQTTTAVAASAQHRQCLGISIVYQCDFISWADFPSIVLRSTLRCWFFLFTAAAACVYNSV